MRWIALFAALAFVPASARADEPTVHLKQAPGGMLSRAIAAPVIASITFQ
ncbi:MAG TPA: hypothetical protein VIH87_08215 [Methylocella sp.]